MKTIKNSNPYRFDFNDWLSAGEKLITLYQEKLTHYDNTQNQYQAVIKNSLTAELITLQQKQQALKKLADTTVWLRYHQFDEQFDKDLIFAHLYSQGFIKELYESAKYTFDLDNTEFKTASFDIFNKQVVEFAERIEDAQFDYYKQIESLSEDYDSSSNSLMDQFRLDDETIDQQTVSLATTEQEVIKVKLAKYCEILRKQYVEPSKAEIAGREGKKASDSKNQLEQNNKRINATIVTEQQNLHTLQKELKNQQSVLKNLITDKTTVIATIDFRYKACLWLKNSRNPLVKPIQYFFGNKINGHIDKIETKIKEFDGKIKIVQTSIQTFENRLKACQTSIEQVKAQFKQNKSHISDLQSKLDAIARLKSKSLEITKAIDSCSQEKIRRSTVKFGH